MQKMEAKSQKAARGGFYWKCKSDYHSSWPGNTFVSDFYFTFSGADSRRAEHVRTYTHATNTWVANKK